MPDKAKGTHRDSKLVSPRSLNFQTAWSPAQRRLEVAEELYINCYLNIMLDNGPPAKKLRTDDQMDDGVFQLSNERAIDQCIEKMNSIEANLKPILDNRYTDSVPLCKAYAATVKSPRSISKVILYLNQNMQTPELYYLKRMKGCKVLFMPLDKTQGLDNIREILKDKCDPEILDLLDGFEVVDIPSRPPIVKWQFLESNKVWPCNFHPNKYNEQLISENFFNDGEIKRHRKFMNLTFDVAKIGFAEQGTNICFGASVVVDPTTDSIVAISGDRRTKHPLQHSIMLAIDNVAKSQEGGNWVYYKNNENTLLNGIEGVYLENLKSKYADIKFGARQSKRKIDGLNDEEGSHVGPYLCTGYYVYTIKEPCIMCAMALVHARARRIFFALDNRETGALKSKCRLQCVKSLNHHFEVFTWFLS